MKKFSVKCEILFQVGEKSPKIENIVVIERNSAMANVIAITELMEKYPKAINIFPYQTDEINS